MMNERFRQLAEQAGAVYSNDHAVSLLDDEIEKFAELIVKECCSAIRLDDAFNGGKFQRTILKHFGVEE
jgi:hypothetical protein